MFNKLFLSTIIVSSIFLSGCSLSNPFGIGYDSSVCTDSKTFGVCGSPSDVYKYRGKIRDVQSKYLKARLDTTLYFGISPEGKVQVKADREGKWENYNSSEWKKIIDKKNSIKKKENTENVKTASAFNSETISDIPVTANNDLSVKYSKQGPLLITRTKVGDIIRDQGLIQKVWIANYVDDDNDLVSSHEVFIVIREPNWIAGESTPKSVNLTDYPTPLSTKILKKQKVLDKKQKKIINLYNENSAAAAAEIHSDLKKSNDLDIIKSYLKN